ncbi:MAG: hypothetical protein ACK4IS_03235 [Erythrobacter sp.]
MIAKVSLISLAPAAAALAALGGAPLAAQSVTYEMTAQVTPACTVTSSSGSSIDVNFGSLANVPPTTTVTVAAGSATYRCNTRIGFTRTITSQNNGWLTLDGNPTTDANRRIRFNMQHGGGSGLSFQPRQLTAPFSRNFPASQPWLSGQSGSVSFEAFGVRAAPGSNGIAGTTVLAGNYRDTVTITLTSN